MAARVCACGRPLLEETTPAPGAVGLRCPACGPVDRWGVVGSRGELVAVGSPDHVWLEEGMTVELPAGPAPRIAQPKRRAA